MQRLKNNYFIPKLVNQKFISGFLTLMKQKKNSSVIETVQPFDLCRPFSEYPAISGKSFSLLNPYLFIFLVQSSLMTIKSSEAYV